MTERVTDTWKGGEPYERYMGRWSRDATREYVAWLDRPAGERWVDVGCGTGALSRAVLDHAAPAAVVALDPSETYLDFARARLLDARASFRQGDALELPLPDDSADVVASAFVLNFVGDPGTALREAMRVVRPGGVVSAMVWDYAQGMGFIRHLWDAALELDPDAEQLDEGRRFPLCRPEPLATLFQSAGLREVRVDAIEIPTHFASFTDFWEPFVGGPGPAPGYVTSLPEDRRRALRSLLEERLAGGSGGAIELAARAWVAAGEKQK